MSPLSWLITGCSSGFGEALALELVKRGDRIIATARNVDSLEHLRGNNVHTIALDLNNSQEDIDKCIHAAQEAFGGIDVLVNNASYLTGGHLEQVRDIHFMEVYKTNLIGTVNVTRAIMPHFRARNAAMVVFMGSMSGWVGNIGATSYCASEFALEGVFEGFQQEAALFGIKSIIIEPVYFRTNIFHPSRLRIDTDPLEAYEEINKQMAAFASAIHGTQPGDPGKAAARIADVVHGEDL
ncbi:short-chain oxidoreductase [Massariosphaeria phaeospora]|uniref:Short-chain oxidoreductase n=1 Tax=Massariosphaeria phaeospora TaxID=100035 RepID=A0A7C8MJI2_9PLEO|nr:short-chain oxidoreductase [Massariosphaeria phaeospora]